MSLVVQGLGRVAVAHHLQLCAVLPDVSSAEASGDGAGLVFDWLLPTHFPVIIAVLEAWADVPEVTTAVLKFMAEFVLNKTQRLTFDSSSPNGILLFREVSKVHTQASMPHMSAPFSRHVQKKRRQIHLGICCCFAEFLREM